ncbi:xanthine dehydrogenase family protein molybdopterin-binding subunit [Elstera litoralis]|uniref:xanthine dehydrogenase family protein molybdopterin-binding subunit n=1 Tax=Elstera litoralis TaxID=552518 RepID=UPI000A05D59D|nr:xanthine dehydrogenase family protein molybdopterin-binding subunit [Elstera litoralis]
MHFHRLSEPKAPQPTVETAWFRPSRRQFLIGAAVTGAGLSIGMPAPGVKAQAAAALSNPFPTYIRLTPDNKVTVLAAHMDMGQGIYNGIATLVAEELGADWSLVTVEGAWGDIKAYGNVTWGGAMQGTGGSSGIASSWVRYRQAGAVARTLLVSAAAKAWGVPAAEIKVENGQLSHASGKKAPLGAFADAAAKEALPASVELKSPDRWTLIGNAAHRRYDSAIKAKGQQDYTIDVQLPGQLVGMILHPPLFGATLKSVDATAAKAVPGVTDVVTITRGVVVLAKDTWSAMKGREALVVTWDESKAEKRGSAQIMADYRALAAKPGTLVEERGSAATGLAGAVKTLEATYEFPYLAHAALEPLNAVVRKDGEVLEVWGGHQMPDLYQGLAAKIAGTTPDKVRLHVMKTGGGFGRRAVIDGDIIAEAVETAKAINFRAPVKLQWTRENDMAGGRYRPLMLHQVKVGLDAKGAITGWQHHIVGQSILIGTPLEAFAVKNGVDATSVEGVAQSPYALPNFRVEVTNTQSPVPVLWWRSVGHTHTAYAMETMIDEIARTAGQDPVALRRQLLKDHPRPLAVLNALAEKAGWDKPLPAGRFRGIALHESFGTMVGMVAEITLQKQGFKVENVVAVVDCGVAVNPDQIAAQIEGGVGFGLGAILREELPLEAGRVAVLNFDGYLPLRIDEMPKVEVHIMPSTAAPTGIGEPGVPVIGPAVANAVAAATGKRVRVLPMEKGLAV